MPSSLRASTLFSEAERLAWRPPQRMGVREWAESYRILRAEDGVARPGAYRSANNPAIDGLMLLSGDFEIEEVVCMAAAQVGKSEWLRNFLAWLADLEPCPVLLVLPDERQGMKIMYKNILPMFENTPRLQPLLPKSRGKGEIAKRNVFLTNGFALTLGWSGSPASLAADPKRVVINDEVDKFAERSGREADPISLAYARTRTYAGQRQILNASTPTWVTGQIYRRFSNCPVQLAYHVPCLNAACGLYQPLAFTQVRWDTVPGMAAQDLAERIEAGRLAWFECVRCGRRHDEREKRAMISRWRFGTNDGRTFGVSADGTREFPRALRVGVHLPALMTPWVEWRHIAAQFLRVKDDPEALREFVNQWLGEPYVPTIARAAPEIVEAKTKAGGPRGIVPPWAASVLVTVDTQKDHFYYVVRAWGPGMRSARIDHGIVMTFAEIRQRLLDVEWPMADGITLPTLRLGIDSGGGAGDDLSRTEEVYRFALSDAIRIVPIKGRSLPSRDGQPWRKSRINYQPRRRAGQAPLAGYDLWLLLLDTNHFKDLLASRMGAKLVTDTGEEVELWGLDNVDDPDYVRQMSSEVKRPLTVGRRSGAVEVWQPISRGAANHYFDCYSEDTELLMRNGWRTFRQIAVGEHAATVNLTTNQIEYQPIERIIDKLHDGEMVHIGGGNLSRLDLLVTPNHRMVGFRSVDSAPEIILAKNLRPAFKLKLRGLPAAASEPSTVRLMAAGDYPAVRVDAADLAEFLGWFIAEGYARARGSYRRIVIYQNKQQRRMQIAALLDRLPWKYFATSRGFMLSNQQVFDQVGRMGDQSQRRIPRWIFDSSPAVMEACLRGLIAGDGWTARNGARRYATISPGLADDVQELLVRTGSWATVAKRKARPYCIRGRSGTNTRDQYWVTERTAEKVSLANSRGVANFRTVSYRGRVVCATVANGTLIVRRNGKIIVCGNCEAYQQGLASSMQAELIRRRVRRPAPPGNNSPRPPGFMADRAPVRRKY